MQKIKSINLSKLRKLDLPDLAESVIKVVENFDPELLKFEEAYDLLVAKQPAIDILKHEYGPHVITPKLGRLRGERNAYVTIIATQARSLSSLEVEGSDDGIKEFGMHCDFYLTNLSRHNERNKHLKLSEFFRKIDESAAFELVLSKTGLTMHLNNLRIVHSQLDEKWQTRDSSIAARPKVSTPPIARSVKNAMSNLFSQINNAQIENVDLDYTLLIAELNRKIAHYTGLINTRKTIAEKKKAQAEAEAEVDVQNGANGETQFAKALGEMTVPADKMIKLSVKEEVKDDSDIIIPLNEEKTAARSSKNEQLPSIEDEDQSITS